MTKFVRVIACTPSAEQLRPKDGKTMVGGAVAAQVLLTLRAMASCAKKPFCRLGFLVLLWQDKSTERISA